MMVSSWNDSVSVVSASGLRMIDSVSVASGPRTSARMKPTMQPSHAQRTARARQHDLVGARRLVRDDVHVDVAGCADDRLADARPGEQREQSAAAARRR